MKKAEEDRDALLSQREATIAFGRMALQSDNLASVLTEACRLTSNALGTDLAKVMELQDDGTSLLVVAGVGWDDGIVGEEKVPALRTSSEGHALATGEPSVSEDITEESRFDYANFLKKHDVHAMVNVIIPGPDGQPPYGLLQVDSREPRDFTHDDVEFLQGYANLIGAAIERHFYQRELGDAMRMKERLLEELQHRVKNSISVIGSILRMKASSSAHPATKQDINDVLQRIETLRELYDQLYASSDVDRVDLGGYLAAVCGNISAFHARADEVHVETGHANVLVEANAAMNLGLVVNEFVTNSIKHKEDGAKLKIRLVIEPIGNGVKISLSDDGPGIGDAVEQKDEFHTGSGIGLIEGLLGHLDCEWDWSSENGTRLEFVMPARRLAT